MLTTAPRLYIRRPSPTTAEFTVTTCPPLTLPLRLLFLTLHLLRVLLAAAAVLTLYSRFLLPTTTTNTPTPTKELLPLFLAGEIPTLAHTILQTAHLSQPGTFLSRLVAPLPDWALALLSLGTIYIALCFQLHTTESVLVLRGLGIQTCSSAAAVGGSGWGSGYGSGTGAGGGGGSKWGWGTQTRFIPTEKIRDVLINEAFRGFEVRYYLIVVVEGEEDVVVLFPGLLPRRKIVEAVWRGIRGCLFEGDEGEKG
jgi:phosphatidylinositol glycan class H protein